MLAGVCSPKKKVFAQKETSRAVNWQRERPVDTFCSQTRKLVTLWKPSGRRRLIFQPLAVARRAMPHRMDLDG